MPRTAPRRLACKNASGEVLPPFAIARVTGASRTANGRRVVYELGKPAESEPDQLLVVNGPQQIAADAQGECSHDWPLPVAYDSADGEPAAGEVWGVADGEWKLKKGEGNVYHRFAIAGDADTTNGVVVAGMGFVCEASP